MQYVKCMTFERVLI